MRKWEFYTAKELKPKGWLKRQLEIQAAGLSGNLDKMWPDIKESAWIGGGREGWERVPYWLDGFIPLAYALENEDMICRAKTYIEAILAAQKEDGWICPCSEEARPTYDPWAIELISKVLVVYYQCSNDERIPDVLYRVLKNYYELLKNGTVSLFGWGEFRWFEALIAIGFTYERRKEAWLKELAQILKKQGADYDSYIELWKTPLNWWRLQTHIVNLNMMLKTEAVGCDLLDEPYSDHAEYLRGILDQYNGTVFEGFTGDECLAGVSPIQGTELCSIVELMYSYEWLYAFTGDPKWAERLEVLAFNALPATLSDDMWTHQYLQMSNQISCEKFPGKAVFRTNGPESHLFGLEPTYGCCTANFNQGWPKFALSAFMRGKNKVLSAFMLPCELNDDGIRVAVETEYPFKNRAKYRVEAQKDFELVIRIPSFAQNVKINGNAFEGSEVCLEIKKGANTEICVEFEAPPCHQKRPNGLYALRAGSLIFSLPIAYETRMHEYERDGVCRKFPYCDYELIPKSAWNYAFCSPELFLEPREISAIPFSSKEPPVVVKNIQFTICQSFGII